MLCAMKKNDKYSLKANTITKYWKYNYEPWTQPVLTANGVLGGDSFGVLARSEYSSNYSAWKAFDGSTTSGWEEAGATDTAWYIFYTPNPINITAIGWALSSSVYGIRNYKLLASNDNISFVDLGSYSNNETSYTTPTIISNNGYYKYYKIQATHSSSSSRIYEFNIIATQQTIVESTQDDYDFTTEEKTYFAFKKG